MALTTQLWSLNALATELGVSARLLGKRLSDLRPDEVEQQDGRQVKRWRLARVLRHIETAGGNGKVPTVPRSQYEAARALREEYTARLRRLEYERAAGQLIPASEITGAWQMLVAAFRAKCLSLPSKLAPQLVAVNESRIIQAALAAAIREALEELARFELPRRPRGNGKAEPESPRRPRTAPVH